MLRSRVFFILRSERFFRATVFGGALCVGLYMGLTNASEGFFGRDEISRLHSTCAVDVMARNGLREWECCPERRVEGISRPC